MRTIAVETIYITDHENIPVPDDMPEEDMPRVYHGPFESIEAAVDWMNNVYPDDDTDVHEQRADVFDVDPAALNDPAGLFS